jgi:hypothetical protein
LNCCSSTRCVLPVALKTPPSPSPDPGADPIQVAFGADVLAAAPSIQAYVDRMRALPVRSAVVM